MKKKLSVIILISVLACFLFAFTGCSHEGLHGTYIDADNRMTLILTEDEAEFGAQYDKFDLYYVNYVNSKTIGISTSSWNCYFKNFDYEFTVNDDGSLTLMGRQSSDGSEIDKNSDKLDSADIDVEIILYKQ